MSMVGSIVTGLNKVIDNRQVTTVIVSAALAHRQLRNGENRTQVEGQQRPVPDRLPGPHEVTEYPDVTVLSVGGTPDQADVQLARSKTPASSPVRT
jgi:hypothetical protein